VAAPDIPAVNLPLQYQEIREEIDAAIRAVLERQSFILGPEVEQLEREVARLQGCAIGIGCGSGSDALLLSLEALAVGAGDEVLVPAFSFFSTAGSVARLGAVPVFVDVEPRTFLISPEAAGEALRQPHGAGPPKAMIPVHLYGQCADMDRLRTLAERNGLEIVEDAAQAILARCCGKPSGSMGRAGCFSFYPTKNLGGFGDGGMITTSDPAMAERLRLLRNHGSLDKREHSLVGVNSRLDTLQAAVLLVKLRHLEKWTHLRRQRAALYRRAFEDAELSHPAAIYPSEDIPVVLPLEARNGEHVYHQFTIRAHRRDELAARLAEKGIGTAVFYPLALPQQPAFSHLRPAPGAFPESERAAQEVLSLPIYPELTEEQQLMVVRQIREFYFP
jgi:dTDP-4-amino-4,6-dideoxygalactose transaminase